MCSEPDSVPPIPPVSGAAVSHDDIVLQASDVNRFAAFRAFPGEDPRAGVVVLPDVRGLCPFYEEVALRLGERDISAVSIDYFGRTAGESKHRDDDFDFMDHAKRTTFDGVQADVSAAIAFLRTPAGGSCAAVFTLGFCFGGSNSWLAAVRNDQLSGAIGFYGRPGPHPLNGSPGARDLASEIKAPILALMGGADEGIPVSEVDTFERALAAAGVEHEVITYERAPHSFFDRRYEEFAEESADAWERTLAFIERNVTIR